MRKSLAIFTALALALMPMSVAAETNDTSVINSGDNAAVQSSVDQTTTVDIFNSNVADINQNVTATADTGHNEASGNIGGGSSIQTGNAAVAATMNVTGNSNQTSVSGGGSMGANMTDVVNTGDWANVDTNLNTTNTVRVNSNNVADLSQNIDAYAHTGHNQTNSNIGGASIVTGNAAVGGQMNTNVNYNTTNVTGMGSNNMLVNPTTVTNTGDNADVFTNANANHMVDITNTNTTYANQSLYADAITGHNMADENIGGNSRIVVGPATVSSAMNTAGNQNMTSVGGGAAQSMMGWNLSDIVNTGDNLFSDTNVDTTHTVRVFNYDTLYSSQYSDIVSRTGHNATNDNIGSAGIGANGAGVGLSFTTQGNTNWTMLR